MNKKPTVPPQDSVSTTPWPVYLVVAGVSGASAFVSLVMAAFSVNSVAYNLSIWTSAVCFTLALILAVRRKVTLAFLLSFATAPISLGVVVLYLDTRSFQVAVVQKVKEISHLIVAEIKDPQPALDRAIREGFIRKATADDVRAFRDAYIEKKYTRRNLPVLATEDALSVTKVDISRAYVVLKKFTYPSGLLDEYRATFFIPIGVPEPNGEIGHSAFYDFGTLTVGCTLARTGDVSC